MHNKARICGYVVVQKPTVSVHADIEGGAVVQKRYQGVDRSRWRVVIDSYYNGTLPTALVEVYEGIKFGSRHDIGFDLCQTLEGATSLVQFSNLQEEGNELIAVYSETLAKLRGTIVAERDALQFLGYDVFALGEWSLLADGYFIAHSRFARWDTSININGLFADTSVIELYINDYMDAARNAIVEPLADPPLGLDRIGVFKSVL